MKYRIAVALIVTLLSVSARGGGTALFYGQLSEAGGNIAVAQGALQSACYRDGQWRRQSPPLARFTRAWLAEQSVQAELAWLDSQQQRRLIIVSYRQQPNVIM